jgi:hypothetical protein
MLNSALRWWGHMQVLLDTCVWGGARAVLEQAGHNVLWAGDWTPDPGDEEILTRAHEQGRVLIMLDKDSVNWLSCAGCRTLASFVSWVSVPANRGHMSTRSSNGMGKNSLPERSSPPNPAGCGFAHQTQTMDR